MSKLTSFKHQIPSRISVSFDTHIDKYSFSVRENGQLKVELNRQVLKDITTPKRFLRHFSFLLGLYDFDRKYPDFHAGDKIIYDGYAQGVLLSEPILTGLFSYHHAPLWIALCRINNKTGYFYIDELKLKKRGRNSGRHTDYNDFPIYCGEKLKRISVTTGNKTNKYVLTHNEHYISLYYNRILKKQFFQHHDISARSFVVNDIFKNYYCGIYDVPKPEIKKGDRLKVYYDLDNEDFRSEICFAAGDPLLNIFSEWVIPCYLYETGMTFVNTDDVKKL